MHLNLMIRGLGLLGASFALAAAAAEVAVPPVLDRSGLPPLGAAWLKGNPYRGNPRALEVGQSAFNQSCARCHGTDANQDGGMPAPDQIAQKMLRQVSALSCLPANAARPPGRMDIASTVLDMP